MVKSPSINKDSVLCWSIYCGGEKLRDNFELTYARITLELNRIGKASLRFNAGDMDKQTFDQTDSSHFKPGTTIRVDIGHVNGEKTLFEGYIIDVGILIGQSRSQMTVECRDYAYPATQGRHNRIFDNKRDSEMIKDVLSEYGQVTVDTTSAKYETFMQYYCTDWDFALSRAQVNGLFISTVGKKISVIAPKVSGSAVLVVTHGVDIIGFDGYLSACGQFSDFRAVSWDPLHQKTEQATSATVSFNAQGDLKPTSISTAKECLLQTDAPTENEALKQWATSTALRAALCRYRGSVSFYGSANAVPGCIIELQGLGKRFNGNAFIGSVVHTIEDNQWITHAQMGISPNPITAEADVVSAPASGITPGIEGLHIGKVKQVNDDPKKENRILVELPWLDGKTKEIWARLSLPYASAKAGFIFPPEKDDEVVIGFFNNDPSHPVILGSMHGSHITSTIVPEAKNNKKAIVTREQLKIEFDEEKKIIAILSPAQNVIEINDDTESITLTDQHKNTITMDKNGITIHSDKDITFKAGGNIVEQASSKISIEAKSDISIKGINVGVAANSGFKATGNGTAELSASGQTTIKGAMVMIN